MVQEFQGNYRWLSNFWPCIVHFESQVFPSAEHAYQAAKSLDPRHRALMTAPIHASVAKKLSKNVALRLDWEQVRLATMKQIVSDKFTRNQALKAALLATGDSQLEEGNYWRDRFWGISPAGSGNGLNHLGKILMQVRKELHA